MTDKEEKTEPAEEEGDTSGQQYDWSAHYDAEGNIYYYNSVTEESSWDAPEHFNPPSPREEGEGATAEGAELTSAEVIPSASSSAWIAYEDDEGRTYYYNQETEETQWDKPDDYVEAAETMGEQDEVEETIESLEASAKETETVPETQEEGEPMQVDEPKPDEAEPEEAIDPAVKRLQDAENALNQPDSVLEPGCIGNVTEVVTSQDGNPQKAILALIDNYDGQSAICGLLGRWLAELKGSSRTKGSETSTPLEGVKDEIREIAQDVVNRIATERFSKEAGDGILDLSKSEAAFLEDMMDSPRWRKLLIDLSASHKDSAVLMYCLGAISKRGHHREIARRVNQSDHFAVFNAMLLSELAVIGRLSVSAGGDSAISVSLDEIIGDLRRSTSTTSYTYLYSQEMLRYLDAKARDETEGKVTSRFRRAIRKWEALSESLESAMMDPTTSSSVAGSSPLFRKRRLDVALTVSDLNQHQRRQRRDDDDNNGSNGNNGALDTAMLNFLRRYSSGIQIDDAILDPLLPTGLDLSGGDVGKLFIKHPLAIRALLGCLYKPGSARVTSPVVKNKCARLIAFATMASEKSAMAEMGSSDNGGEGVSGSDEVALTRMILQGSQLCEQLEIMVSFLVTTDSASAKPSTSPGQKLCSLAFSCAPVAQGTIMWARELTCGPEFAASPSFPTLSTSILSLVRLVCEKQPFTRRDGVEIALCFLHHFNADISYQKVNAIKERSLRLLIHLLAQGEVSLVLSSVTSRLEQKGSSDLDASLIRYFVGGILQVVGAPVSIVFIRSFGALLMAPKCVDAVRTSYFGEPNRQRLVDLLKSFQDIGKLSAEDASLVSSLLMTYQVK